MIKILVLLYCFAEIFTFQCSPITCLDDTTENKDKCRIQIDIPFSLQIKACPIGQSCTKRDGITTYCEKKKKDEESCTSNDDCYSEKCENSVCVGKGEGESCTLQEECLKTLHCSQQCKPFKNVGEECKYSLECPFGYGCGSAKDGDNKTCIKLYSIKNGDYSTAGELCETGYTSRDNKCATTSSEREGAECTQDADCIIKVKAGDTQEVENYGKCDCNIVSGKKVCEYSTTNINVQNYLKGLKDYFNTENTNKYIALAKTDLNYQLKKLMISSQIQFKEAPDCIIDFFIGRNPSPSSSSSRFIRMSFILFGLFFIM